MVNSPEPELPLCKSTNSPEQNSIPGLSESLRAPVVVLGNSNHLSASIRVGDSLAVFHPGPKATSRGNKLYLLDGVGIAGSTTIVDSGDVSEFLDRDMQREPAKVVAERWGESIKNPCAAFVIDTAAQEVLCLPDPLGGALTFRYRSDHAQIISTDMVSLTNVVTAMGLPLKKSADFQLERLILGNGGLIPSSYERVDRLELFEYWLVSRDGVERCEYRENQSELTYVESVQAISAEISESVLAVSRLPTERRIAHITGGFDSRLVLAAAMATGCADDFMYFCSGPAGSTDRKIADGLSQTFELRRSSGGGLAASPLAQVHEQLLAPLYHSGGITSSGPNGGETKSSVVVAGGGYGGILRSTFSSRFSTIDPKKVSPITLIEMLAPRPTGSAQIYAGSTLSLLGERLFQEWNRLRDKGYEQDAIGDALYLSVRNRYHFGQNSMLWSRIGRRYDPLYSVSAATAAAGLPLYSRQTNVLGFDVMRSFGVDMEKFPFDTKKFSDAYRTLRRTPEQRKFEGSGRIEFDDSYRTIYDGKVNLPSSLDGLAVTTPALSSNERRATIEMANKIGLNYWHIATLESAQRSLRSALNQFGLSAVEGLVDSKYAWHLAKDHLTKRAEIRDVYAMYGLVAWLGVDA